VDLCQRHAHQWAGAGTGQMVQPLARLWILTCGERERRTFSCIWKPCAVMA
jgi:hypothetical protein